MFIEFTQVIVPFNWLLHRSRQRRSDTYSPVSWKGRPLIDDKMVLLQDYISKNAITDNELAEGRYTELEKEYREAQAEKVKLQDELTERRRRSLMIKRFIDEVSGFDEAFTEFSENLWLGLVDVMVVVDKKEFRVKFKSGMEVPVEL